MSRFYGTVVGQAKTIGTRRGSRDITTAAQSWHGSVITRLSYNDAGELMVEIETSEDSATRGYTKFYGTFENFKRILEGANA